MLEKIGILDLVELVGLNLSLVIKIILRNFTNCALREPFVGNFWTDELILIGILSKQGLNRPDVLPLQAHFDMDVVAHIHRDKLVN